jgi:uncharacterized membrane protein
MQNNALKMNQFMQEGNVSVIFFLFLHQWQHPELLKIPPFCSVLN